MMRVFWDNWRTVAIESRSRRETSMTLHVVFNQCFSCVVPSMILSSCLSGEKSSYSRHIDSREVCQSPIPSVCREMFEYVHVQLLQRLRSVLSCSIVAVVFVFCRFALSYFVKRQIALRWAYEIIPSASHIRRHRAPRHLHKYQCRLWHCLQQIIRNQLRDQG